MKNRFIVVYSIFAAIVFIFSLSFFGFNLYNEYSTNIEKSEKKFKTLTNDVRSLSFNHQENSSDYAKAIKNVIGDPSDYSFIQVKRDNSTIVLYPSKAKLEETYSKLSKIYEKKLTVNNREITIVSNIYLIRPDSIFYYARISFLIVLIITLITVIMIIYLNITEKTSTVITSENNEIENEQNSDKEIPESHEEIPEIHEEVKNYFDDELNDDSEEDDKSESENEPLTESQSEPAELPLDEVQPAEIKADPASDDPSGLFDPETGIGWESYLMTRLENEINRATASEIDLSLFIFELKSITKESAEFKNVCNYLALQFQFKDLLFEYRDDCIVAIKISMNIDEAINFADKLYTDICNIINNKNCFIGISSRSIRMVTGQRMMLEADQALKHANDDSTTPIIAFRVDSEKYRMLMEQNHQ